VLIGREEGQLWYPRKVAVIRTTGKYVVCDRGSERSRMQLFTKNGQFIKKIAIRYIDIVAGLAITAQGTRQQLASFGCFSVHFLDRCASASPQCTSTYSPPPIHYDIHVTVNIFYQTTFGQH